MNTHRISVIIPVYNHAADLVTCLRALKKQTYPSLELIVVNDRSSDHPKETVQAAGLFDGIDAWIDLEKNQGAPVARNRGFAASSGSFVLFLDADAIVRPDGIERMLKALVDHPDAAFSYGAFRFGKKIFLSGPFSVEKLAKQNDIHTSSLIRRESFPGFDPSLKKFQDWDLWLQIAEAGGEGVYIPELLMDIRERKQDGMSRWIPGFAYRLPWRLIGREPEMIVKFREAEKIIRTKHHVWMEKIHAQTIQPTLHSKGWMLLAVMLALASFVSIGTMWSSICAALLALAMVVTAYKKPAFALALLGFELILGSKGGWLKMGADAVNDGGIGIRILLFVAFFIGWGAWIIRKKEWNRLKALVAMKELLPFAALGGVLVWTVLRGWVLHQPFLISDANAWGFLLILIPAIVLWKKDESSLAIEFRSMVPVGIGLLTFMTLALFVLFSQAVHLTVLTDIVYTWIRESGLGEITRTEYGIYRIFLASQIMLIPAWLWMYVRATQDHRPFTIKTWLAWMGMGAAIIVSFSRSFWMGTAVAAIMVAAVAWVSSTEGIKEQVHRLILRPLIAGLGAFACIFLVASIALTSVIGSRFASGEAAASSRWDLLTVMESGIQRHPIRGSGFGATLTYPSHDPRIVAKTGGMYTTYAFEWGWLDVWYKMGIFGVIALIWVLGSIIVSAARFPMEKRLFVWVSVLALAVIHMFTPYINHPLGIGMIVVLVVLTQPRVRSTSAPCLTRT